MGAITRGSEVLDGVTSGLLDSIGTRELAGFLKGSRQLGQVRVIFFESVDGIDPFLLSESVGKPIIKLVHKSLFDGVMTFRFNNLIVKPVGIDGPSAMRVLKVISRDNEIPALEIARKIADSLL